MTNPRVEFVFFPQTQTMNNKRGESVKHRLRKKRRMRRRRRKRRGRRKKRD